MIDIRLCCDEWGETKYDWIMWQLPCVPRVGEYVRITEPIAYSSLYEVSGVNYSDDSSEYRVTIMLERLT